MKCFIHDERGQGLTEYIILLMLVSIVSIAAVKTLGNEIKDRLQHARKKINEEVVVQ